VNIITGNNKYAEVFSNISTKNNQLDTNTIGELYLLQSYEYAYDVSILLN
jgi:hypothetical protein